MERYINYLNPKQQSTKWSLEEEKKLISILSSPNKRSWKSLEKDFPGRTDVFIKNKSKTKRIKNGTPDGQIKKEPSSVEIIFEMKEIQFPRNAGNNEDGDSGLFSFLENSSREWENILF
jgi:hypothetical protein